MGAGRHALGRFGGGQHGAQREAAADALGHRHDVGGDAHPFMGEELAGAADAGLDLVKDQQQALVIADLAQGAQEFGRNRMHAALALQGLDDQSRGLRPDHGVQRVQVIHRDMVEAFHLGAEAFQILVVAGGIDRAIGAAMKGAREADDMEAFGMAVDELVAAGGLDRQFHRLGARIGEEYRVGKGGLGQPARQAFLARHPIQVGDMPQLARLLGQGRIQAWVGMAESCDSNAGAQVQISLPVLGKEV